MILVDAIYSFVTPRSAAGSSFSIEERGEGDDGVIHLQRSSLCKRDKRCSGKKVKAASARLVFGKRRSKGTGGKNGLVGLHALGDGTWKEEQCECGQSCNGGQRVQCAPQARLFPRGGFGT